MINLNNLWYLKEKKEQKVHKDGILNKIFLNRGLNNSKEVEKFIKTDYSYLKDPYELTDMDIAVKRIVKALLNNEKILIYGDYDVDGITSTSLLINFFKDIEFDNYNFYIPNRLTEGYGLSIDSIKNIEIDKYDLIITVDCGITAVEEVDYLKEKDLDIIITDHHKLGDELPRAEAVIDPQRESSHYFKVLAGVGVVFKVLQAVAEKLDFNNIKEHLDLVALGTVADIVELKNDNRIIVKQGLELIRNTNKLGLKQLLIDLQLDNKPINPGQIGYIVAPPINAIGRMEEPDKGVQLLTTEDETRAKKISKKLISINRDRQKKEEEIYQDALSLIDPEEIKRQEPIVLASENWHRGVIGIVASRLVEKYYLPVILIAIDEEGIGHGSARSINQLDITEGLKSAEAYLENFGGHSMAAGLSIQSENIEPFKEKLNSYIKETLSPKDFVPGIHIDAIIEADEINAALHEKLEVLKPYGVGNPRPKFLLSNIKLKNHYTVGSDNKHLKVKLKNGVSGICFNMGEINNKINNKNIDLVVKVYMNNWRGRDEVEVRVEDINIRPDHSYFPITFKKNNYTVYDKRWIKDKVKYLKGLYSYHNNIAVYINGDNKAAKLKNNLEKEGISVVQNNWQNFNDGENKVILFNNVFNKKIKKDTHLVLYSVPFSFSALYDILNNFKIDNQVIHLIYNNKDLYLNEQLIETKLPSEKLLKEIYEDLINSSSDYEVKKNTLFNQLKEQKNIKKSLFNKIWEILEEKDIIVENQGGYYIKAQNNTELDLSNSVYYNNIIKIKKEYKNFKKSLEDKNLFNFINNLTKLEEEYNEFQ